MDTIESPPAPVNAHRVTLDAILQLRYFLQFVENAGYITISTDRIRSLVPWFLPRLVERLRSARIEERHVRRLACGYLARRSSAPLDLLAQELFAFVLYLQSRGLHVGDSAGLLDMRWEDHAQKVFKLALDFLDDKWVTT